MVFNPIPTDIFPAQSHGKHTASLMNRFKTHGLYYRCFHAVFQGRAHCPCSQLSDQCLCRFCILRTDGLYSWHRGRTYWKTNPIRWTSLCNISILFSSISSALIFPQHFTLAFTSFFLKQSLNNHQKAKWSMTNKWTWIPDEAIDFYSRSRPYLRGLRTGSVHATHRTFMVRALLSHAHLCGNGYNSKFCLWCPVVGNLIHHFLPSEM